MSSRNIETVKSFRETLAAGSYTFPGLYPLYFITSDGAALSFKAAKSEQEAIEESIEEQLGDGWQVIAVAINYEDTSLYCDHLGERIECALL